MSAKSRKTDAYGVCKWCREKEDSKKKHAPVCNMYIPAMCICEVCGKPYNQHEG